MSDTVISVENVSKQYRLGTISSGTLSHDLNRAWARLRGKPDPLAKIGSESGSGSHPSSFIPHPSDYIWALRDVSFEVKEGEVLGIIGKNGAGKSTLLKILSRVTAPTAGQIKVKGRIASLLEVGTGFHPELTGRENVFLNGAILGMSRAEIQRKFDEIVAFAEVEQFIDTPVKRYSSGMYVRLAFAVAAHLEPEILVVDEVLAVGDAEFQKKCLGKMGNVAKEGRTVLFVSHNMGAINNLCQSAAWLDQGYLKVLGIADNVVASYLGSHAVGGERWWKDIGEAPGNSKMRLLAVRVINYEHKVSSALDITRPFYVEIVHEIRQMLSNVRVAFRLLGSDGTVVFTSSDSNDRSWGGKPRLPGLYVSRCEIPGNLLNDGQYTLTVSADIPFVEVLFFAESVISFHVDQTGGVSGRFPERWPGLICPALRWQVEPFSELASAPAGVN